MLRAVFDTSVLVAAVVGRGVCATLLDAAQRKAFRLYFSEYILRELEEVLARRKFAALTAVYPRRVLVRRVLSAGTIVRVSAVQRLVTDDPKDDPIVQCARVVKARYLASLDPHLLAMHEHKGVLMVRPEVLHHLIEEHGLL